MPINNKFVSTIPEVQAFETAKRELEEFKAAHEAFYNDLVRLLDIYNAARDAADKVVRAQQVSCGPFQLAARPSVSYDAEKLYEEMGEPFFFAHGGKVENKPVYVVNKPQVEAAIAAGLVPDEVVESVRRINVRYHTPKKAELP